MSAFNNIMLCEIVLLVLETVSRLGRNHKLQSITRSLLLILFYFMLV